MNKLNARLVLAAVVSTVLLAGCGGGGGGGGGSDSAAGTTTPGSPQTVAAVVDYINNLITGTSENGDLVDVNLLTLAADDSGEPIAID